jgi:hypothetical protein
MSDTEPEPSSEPEAVDSQDSTPPDEVYLVQYTYEVKLPAGRTPRADELIRRMLVDRADGSRPTNYTRAVLSWLVDRYQAAPDDMAELVTELDLKIQRIDEDFVRRGHV